MPVDAPLLVTSRAVFARQITALVPDVAVTSTAPEAVTVEAWVSAPVVVVDYAALSVLRARALPAASHVWVVTDGPPVAAVFVDAVELRVDRVVELPLGGPWLASALGSAARRGSVLAVVGIGTSAAAAATLVTVALAVDTLRSDHPVALVGLHRGQTVADILAAAGTATPTPDPGRVGRLTVVTGGDHPAGPGHLPRLITDLARRHEQVILDTPPPPQRGGREALDRADLILAVAAPDQRHHPALAALTAPDSDSADRVRVAVLTADPARADGWGHPIIPPDTDPTRWITDPHIARQCTTAIAEPVPG